MKAVIYARYSSNTQTEQSIEGQLRECYSFAESHDLTVVGTYIDRAISGTTDNRSEFQRLIRDGDKKTFEAIITYKLDRFTRNRYDGAIYKARLKKNGIKLFYAKESIPEGPEGIILESLLEGMAEYYSVELSQKIRRGMLESALKGRCTGGNIALGYKVTPDKTFVIDEDEAAIVRQIFGLYDSGLTVKTICDKMNGMNLHTSRGAAAADTKRNPTRSRATSGRIRHGSQKKKRKWRRELAPAFGWTLGIPCCYRNWIGR